MKTKLLLNEMALCLMFFFSACGGDKVDTEITDGEQAQVETPVEVAEPTYAEMLGWEKGTRALILHVDDAGMSHDSNVGTWRALDDGAANSVSIMMPCPWVPEFAKYVRENPEADAGLHLTLTSEWDYLRWPPLAGKPVVPGLTDEQGCLWGNVELVVQNASPDEVEIEIRAQIERARNIGFEPTHMDSHMGTLFATPAFLERYIKVGIEEQIPVMFPGGHNTYISKESPDANSAEYKALGKKIWDGGLPVLDDLYADTYAFKELNKVDKFVEIIRGTKPGVTMIILHCTQPFENFKHISPTSETLRHGDLLAMLDPRIKEVIKEEGIVMTTFREMKKRRDALKPVMPEVTETVDAQD